MGDVMHYRLATQWLSAILLASLALLAWSAAIAKNTAAVQECLLTTRVIRATPEGQRLADQQLQSKVEDALCSDPYFYSAHVMVSVEGGTVVLHGFVFSDWDLRDAIRIATDAAAGARVVNDLAIAVGGRR
jgi:osmotically-inducible protein OsmY